MSRAARERWATAHDRYDRTRQKFERGLDKLEPVTESSEDGEVSVEIDARGKVTRVTVGGSWERESEPRQLGTLILGTLARAQVTQLGRWAEASAPEDPAPITTRPVRQPDYHIPTVHGAAGDSLVSDAVREVGGLRGAVGELMDEMKAVAAAQHSGRSSSGHATAAANGRSEIVALEFDEEWLGHAHNFNIGREALEAMQDAMRRAAGVTLEQVFDKSRLGRLQGLLTQRAGITSAQTPSAPTPSAQTPPSDDGPTDQHPRSNP